MASLPCLSRTPQAPGIDLVTYALEGPHGVDPKKEIYIDAEAPERALNVSQFLRLVKTLLAGLKAVGLRKGDSVLLNLTNNIFYSAIFFAIIGAGGVVVGINPASRSSELDHSIELTDPKYVITTRNALEKVLSAAFSHSIPIERVYVLDPKNFPIGVDLNCPPSPPKSPGYDGVSSESGEVQGLTSLLGYGQSDWIRFSNETVAKATPAALYSTSGTSGLPKAAVLSHYAMVCQNISVQSSPPYEVRRLMTLPFFHVFAALFVHVQPIRQGEPLYVLPRFHLEQYAQCIESFAITDTLMAPPMVNALNNSPFPLSRMVHTIRYIGVGGAPIDSSTMQNLQDVLHPSATLSQVWGMTEIGAAMLHQFGEIGHLGSVGKPLPGYEMKLLDAFGGLITSDHEPGELQVRYPGMMTGYRGQKLLEENSWYSTGDIMSRIDQRYHVVGRSKELIKVNGFQVSPAELEATLTTHPCITDAAVIGAMRADGVTEVPRAFIIRKSSDGRCSTLSAEEVYTYTAERLSSYKRLDGGIVFVDDIPRTASGKIQRFRLAQMDKYRRSITDMLIGNDDLVKKEDVHELKGYLPNRRSVRLKRGASSETNEKVVPKKPKRRKIMSLKAKMKALEDSKSSVLSSQINVARCENE